MVIDEQLKVMCAEQEVKSSLEEVITDMKLVLGALGSPASEKVKRDRLLPARIVR